MRLNTIGRRSGQPRVAIVGYYEDGPNLITLAMNGWADVDPAWWLNLQAQPDTTVDLADGSHPVRARVAAGEKRARLWAKLRNYRGWGDDLGALAARRSTETAVDGDGGRGARTPHRVAAGASMTSVSAMHINRGAPVCASFISVLVTGHGVVTAV